MLRRTAGVVTVATALLLLAGTAFAEPEGGAPGTLVGPDERPLPLLGTRVDADVTGTVASVRVLQVFENPLRDPIEAVYTFPLPDRAAVDGVVAQIGARTIRSELLERGEAKARYAGAIDDGRTAALTTQLRPNLFTQRIANILPGERIVVELTYTEDLVRLDGETTFVFPVVAAPRCGSQPGMPRDGEAFFRPGELPAHGLDLTVRVDAGFPITSMGSASHLVDVRADGGPSALVTLHPADRIPDHDFVLTWRTETAEPEVAVAAHRVGADGTFCLTIQPEETAEVAALVPREMILVLDTSGSMEGDPLDVAKDVAIRVLRMLGPGDTFRVLKFADGAESYSINALPATRPDVAGAVRWVRRMKGDGGTALLAGLREALRAPEEPYRARTVLFLTDGLINGEREVLTELRESVGNARVFGLGIGSSVNRFLLERLASLGHGFASFLRDDAGRDEVEASVDRFLDRIRSPVLHRLEIDWGGLRVRDVEPVSIPDVFAGQPIRIYGRYDGATAGTITVRGVRGSAWWEKSAVVALPATERHHAALPRLWARERIRRLVLAEYGGELPDVSREVTDLALEYRLLTRHTAFVAVDERTVTDGSRPVRVRQRAAWPRGVGAGDFYGILVESPRTNPFPHRAAPEEPRPVASRESRPTFGPVRVSPRDDVARLLEWQEENGSFAGGGELLGDVGATALALLSLDAAGVQPGRGLEGHAMRRAFGWLAREQGPKGVFGPVDGPDTILDHSLATIAWITGGERTGWQYGRSRTRRAIAFLESRRIPELGWERDGGDGGSDTLATAFATIALAHARAAEFDVDDAALRGAQTHLDAATDFATGLVGPSLVPSPETDGRTIAAAILARAALGEKAKRVSYLRAGARRLLELPPAVGPRADPFALFLTAAALKLVGDDTLGQWDPPLNEAVRRGMVPDAAPDRHAPALLVGPPHARVGRAAALSLFGLARSLFVKKPRTFPLKHL